MVRPQLKRPRTHDLNHTTVAGNEGDSAQVNLYRILTENANLHYACSLCLTGYSRYDHLYSHIKETNEEQHKALQRLWFSGQCTVCHEPSVQGMFKHIKYRHPENYQILMKFTLHIRPEVEVTIPAAPECFRHTFFFPLRTLDSIITCPPKKRKTSKPTTRQDIDGNQRASFSMKDSALSAMEPGDQVSNPGHEPFLYTDMHGHPVDSGSNLEASHLANASDPRMMSMEPFHEHSQGEVSLRYRGSMTLLNAQWPVELNDICHFNGENTQDSASEAGMAHIRRS